MQNYDVFGPENQSRANNEFMVSPVILDDYIVSYLAPKIQTLHAFPVPYQINELLGIIIK